MKNNSIINTDNIGILDHLPMLSLTTIVELDQIVLSHLDPPQILRMSEVNTYFKGLCEDKCQMINGPKYDIDLVLQQNNDWIIQWQIEQLDILFRMLIPRGMLRHNNMMDEYIRKAFYYNNIALLDQMLKYQHISNIYMSYARYKHAYDSEYFKYNFYIHAKQRISESFGIPHGNIPTEQAINILCNLINNKKYDDILNIIDHMSKKKMAKIFKKILTGNQTRMIQKKYQFNMIEVLSDNTALRFYKCLFDKLNIQRPVYFYAFHQASRKEDDAIFWSLVEKYNDNIDDSVMKKAIYNACKFGHLKIMQWAFNNYKNTYNIHKTNSYLGVKYTLFELAIIRSHLHIARWLVNLCENNKEKYGQINIHRRIEYCFRHACKYTDKTLVQYLIELGETSYGKINIHTHQNQAIRYALEKCDFELAKYLIELGNDSYGQFDFAKLNMPQQCPFGIDSKVYVDMCEWFDMQSVRAFIYS